VYIVAAKLRRKDNYCSESQNNQGDNSENKGRLLLVPIENAPDLFWPEHKNQKPSGKKNNPGAEYYPEVSTFTSGEKKNNRQGKSYHSGKVYSFALLEKSHQFFNDIGPEKIRNPHKNKEYAQTLDNYNNTHQFPFPLACNGIEFQTDALPIL
jgi:hypothetical protein